MNKQSIFITGATGNLGSQILKQTIISKKYSKVILLIRGKNKHHAKKRLVEILKNLFNDNYSIRLLSCIKILVGDITQRNFGLSKSEYKHLVKVVDVIFHCAALVNFQDPIEELYKVNVFGTKQILKLVSKSSKLSELNYISTAFIAGNYNGHFYENNFDVKQGFNNPYEKSKFEAEKEVRSFSSGSQIVRIFRPSIIVGEYKTGRILDFQMFYKPLYLLSKEVFKEVPINKKTLLNLIPVDIAGEMIFKLSNKNITRKLAVYHIVNPYPYNILEVINLASSYFDFKKPKLVEIITRRNSSYLKVHGRLLKPLFSYFQLKVKFNSYNTISCLNEIGFYFPKMDLSFLLRLFRYANKKGFLVKSKKFS